MIIGITGRKRSGKSTAARLIEDLAPGTAAIAFADPLKDFLAHVYDWPREKFEDEVFKETPDRRYVRLNHGQINVEGGGHRGDELRDILRLTPEELQDYEDTGAVHLTPRRAAQQLGTEWGRGCYEKTWVDVGMRRARHLERDHPLVLITDCRFLNEAEAIRAAGGVILRVTRAGNANEDGHASEQEMSGIEPDIEIANDGSFSDFACALLKFLEPLLQRVSAKIDADIDARLRAMAQRPPVDTRPPLTVEALQHEAYETAKDKGWHDEDDQPPRAAVRFIAQEGLRIAAIAQRIEAHRKGEAPNDESLNHLGTRGLSDRQVRVIAWLALINTEVAEAVEDVIAGRWETTRNEKGKPEGLGSELADIVIRTFDDAGALGIDLGAALRMKLDYNRARSYRHGGKLA
jgi:hypothetical protein